MDVLWSLYFVYLSVPVKEREDPPRRMSRAEKRVVHLGSLDPAPSQAAAPSGMST